MRISVRGGVARARERRSTHETGIAGKTGAGADEAARARSTFPRAGSVHQHLSRGAAGGDARGDELRAYTGPSDARN